MAIRHVRDAFNEEAKGHAVCHEALLRYEDNGSGGQHQIITVKGVRADGTMFVIATPAHAMADDPHHHVRLLAQAMKEEPVVEAAGEQPATGSSHQGSTPLQVAPAQAVGVSAGANLNLPNPFSRQ